MYNVLWIDDEWDKMKAFKEECEEFHGLHLEPYKVRRLGIEALEKNLDHWHAVLLDARMFDESENELASLTGLSKAKQRLDELKLKKDIPYFISTGQPDLLSSEDFKALFGDFYKKGQDDVRLMNDMIIAINQTETARIHFLYKDVFEALKKLGIIDVSEEILTPILVAMHYPAKDPNFRPVHHYNQLRQLIEYLFRVCHKVGLLPDLCISDDRVNLNQSSLYLAGKDAEKIGLRYGEKGERVIPDYIESIVRSVLEFGNIHSHTVDLSDEDNLKIQMVFKTAKSRFVIFGLALQLSEAVMWFADYIANHKDKNSNLSYCKKLEEKVLSIDSANSMYLNKNFVPEKDGNGIWHCGECYVRCRNNSEIIITSVSLNTDKNTKLKYPYYAQYRVRGK